MNMCAGIGSSFLPQSVNLLVGSLFTVIDYGMIVSQYMSVQDVLDRAVEAD